MHLEEHLDTPGITSGLGCLHAFGWRDLVSGHFSVLFGQAGFALGRHSSYLS